MTRLTASCSALGPARTRQHDGFPSESAEWQRGGDQTDPGDPCCSQTWLQPNTNTPGNHVGRARRQRRQVSRTSRSWSECHASCRWLWSESKTEAGTEADQLALSRAMAHRETALGARGACHFLARQVDRAWTREPEFIPVNHVMAHGGMTLGAAGRQSLDE